ncbi:DUF308 domain-containing protein [Aliihoeflea sp. PC F10.4]
MSRANTALNASIKALRGIVMIVAGFFVITYPVEAVRFVLLAGGGLLVLDGILNLTSLNFWGHRDLEYWIGLVRSLLAIATGLMIIFAPWLGSILSMDVLRWLIGGQAILVGVAEMATLLVRPKISAIETPAWTTVISGGTYALFGLLLIFMPADIAAILARIVGVLMVVFAISLFVETWSLRAMGTRR